MKNFKKIILLLLIFFSFHSFAQGGRFKEKREQIKTLKVAFITDKLNLTSAEAEKFWPLYNAFDEKQNNFRQQKMRSYMDRMNDGNIDNLSDKEASDFLSQIENTEDEMYQSRKKFTTSLKAILPAIKILKLKKTEEDFNRTLLKQYRDKGRKE